MQIEVDDLSRSQVHALLQAHLDAMHANSPPGSVHAPAHRLYEHFGFRRCGPFGAYIEDHFSVFMTKQLSGQQASTSPFLEQTN